MTPLPALVPDRRSPRLLARTVSGRTELWTETVGRLPAVYGERWRDEARRTIRAFEPGRSKLAAGLAAGWRGPVPAPGERWLYLGAASGSTATHVADLVGAAGRVYAVERSLRAFARLLPTAERWPNLLPVLGDAREPRGYADLVPPVVGLYADVAQPDQVELVARNAELLAAGPGAAILIALKTASLGRDREARGHLRSAEESLLAWVELAPSVSLERTHRAHFLVGGTLRRTTVRPGGPPRERPHARPPGRRGR